MPLPKPLPDQGQQEFISGCMANPKMIGEYPREDQRLAVCYTQWRDRNKK
jgi:hypothetical protein